MAIWLRIDGISGTSAGAMNAVVLVDGYEKAGPEGARAALEEFWRRSRMPPDSVPSGGAPWMFSWVGGRWTARPFFVAFDMAARLFSPYDLNPRGANPLRDILADCVDFERDSEVVNPFVRDCDQRSHRPRPRIPK